MTPFFYHVETYTQKASELLSSFSTHPHPDALHDIRVALRRLRSLAEIFSFNDKEKITLLAIKKLAHVGGEIRDFDTLLAVLTIPSLLYEVEHKREETFRVFCDMVQFDVKNLHELSKILKRKGEEEEKKISLLTAKCIQKNLLRIQILLSLPHKSWNEWHTLRKLFKRIRYACELIDLEIFARLGENARILQDILGALNDRCVWIDTLTRYAPYEKELSNQWKHERELLIIKGEEALHAHFNDIEWELYLLAIDEFIYMQEQI